jgi:hypothetical protein
MQIGLHNKEIVYERSRAREKGNQLLLPLHKSFMLLAFSRFFSAPERTRIPRAAWLERVICVGELARFPMATYKVNIGENCQQRTRRTAC